MSRSSLHPLIQKRIEAWERDMLTWLCKPRVPAHRPEKDQSGSAYPDLYPAKPCKPPVYEKNEFESKQESIKEAASKAKSILRERCFSTWIDALPEKHRESLVQALVSGIIRLVYLPADIAYRGWPERDRELIRDIKSLLPKRKNKTQEQNEKQERREPKTFLDYLRLFELLLVTSPVEQLEDIGILESSDDDALPKLLSAIDLLKRAVSSIDVSSIQAYTLPPGRPYADWRPWLRAFYAGICYVNSQAPVRLVVSERAAVRIVHAAGFRKIVKHNEQQAADIMNFWRDLHA